MPTIFSLTLVLGLLTFAPTTRANVEVPELTITPFQSSSENAHAVVVDHQSGLGSFRFSRARDNHSLSVVDIYVFDIQTSEGKRVEPNSITLHQRDSKNDEAVPVESGLYRIDAVKLNQPLHQLQFDFAGEDSSAPFSAKVAFVESGDVVGSFTLNFSTHIPGDDNSLAKLSVKAVQPKRQLTGMRTRTELLHVVLSEVSNEADINQLHIIPTILESDPHEYDFTTNFRWIEEDENCTEIEPKGCGSQAAIFRVPEIKRGDIREVRAEIKNLQYGTYKLEFEAEYPGMDQNNKKAFSFEFTVKQSIEYPVLILIFATLLSFGTTKYLIALKARADIMNTLHKNRPKGELANHTFPAAVGTRALIKQIEKALEKRRVVGESSKVVLDEWLAKLEKATPLMNRIVRLHELVKDWQVHPMLKRRVQKNLRAIQNTINLDQTDAETKNLLETRLTAIESWVRGDTQQKEQIEAYRASLEKDVENLKDAIEASVFADTEGDVGRVATRILTDDLKGNGGDTMDSLVYRESQYSKLKVLYEQRNNGNRAVLEKLVELLTRPRVDVEEVFRVVDEEVVNRIKNDPKRLSIQLPNQDAESYERFQLLEFSVVSHDDIVKNSFTFKHGLEYRWQFKGKGAFGTSSIVRQTTRSTSVRQFMPNTGRYEVVVEVWWKNQRLCTLELENNLLIQISEMSALSVLKNLERHDGIGLAVAVLVALIAGIEANYIPNDTWGGMEDWLKIFAWGIAADQAKNLVSLTRSN